MTATNWLVDDEELDRYEDAVRGYLAGELEEARLMAIRLQQGVYGQRQEGHNMVRIKLPGGRLDREQLAAIAEALERFSREAAASITTRQDIQLHTVPLQSTPAALRHLARHGLTTREACGNTVRNISACPLAGVCPREHVNVQHYVGETARRLLRHPLTQHMPRKYKVAFSGCEVDCAQGMIHDLGVVAVRQGERCGFRVVAGGGLGHKPREAVVIEPFVDEQDLQPVIEAVIAVHNRYSDRSKRAKSRLKFLVDAFGPEGFVARYREELGRVRAVWDAPSSFAAHWGPARAAKPCGAGAPRGVFAQKQTGLFAMAVHAPLGDLTAAQLRGLVELMEREALNEARATQDQNLVLLNIPGERLAEVGTALGALGIGEPDAGDDVVSCPGTWTCRLGITAAKPLAEKLDGGGDDLRIRVSGCQSACAQPHLGDIGLHGEARRIQGRLVPHYRMHFGGHGCAGGGLGTDGPEIPAARIQEAIRRVKDAYRTDHRKDETFFEWSRRRPAGFYDELLSDLTRVAPWELDLVLRDHGAEDEFRVLALGGGECAGLAQETVAARFAEAANERTYRSSFLVARKLDQALECAEAITRLVGQALLHVCRGDARLQDASEIARQLEQRLPEHTELAEMLATLAEDIARLREEFDEALFTRVIEAQDIWTVLAGRLCQEREPLVDLGRLLPRIKEKVAAA